MLNNRDPFYTAPTDEMHNTWGQFLKKESKPAQDQSSTMSQVKDLYYIAIKIGKYDAANYLKRNIENTENGFSIIFEE